MNQTPTDKNRQELLKKAAQCYVKEGWLAEACRVWIQIGDYSQAAQIYEEQGQWAEAANCYRQAQNWTKAAECYVKQGEVETAAECWLSGGEILKAAWIWVSQLKQIYRTKEILSSFEVQTEIQRIERELIIAHCEASTGKKQESAQRLKQQLEPLLNNPQAHLYECALTIAAVIKRPDITALIYATGVRANLANANTQWEKWAIAKLGDATGVSNYIEDVINAQKVFDIHSQLVRERIVFLGQEINDESAQLIIAQLLFLEAEDVQKTIYLYIDSTGGSVIAGLAIYDIIQYIRPDVVTVCIGLAAGMAGFLLATGTRGKRFALPSSRIMICQTSGGAQGRGVDIEIQAREILYLNKKLTELLASATGQTCDKIALDTERDYYMSAQEAREYGMIDQIIERKPSSSNPL